MGVRIGAAPPAVGQALMSERARSFAFAARFLPAAMRPEVAALYAFCRTVDDLVDEPAPGLTIEQVRRQLAEWRQWLLATPVSANGSAMTNAVAAVINRRGIPQEHLRELLDGCLSDLNRPCFEHFGDLRRYCYQVGSTVGLAM